MAQAGLSLFAHLKEALVNSMNLTSGATLALVARVIDTLFAQTREPLLEFSSALSEVVNAVMKVAPAEAKNAARGLPGASDEAKSAFVLGQLLFAQNIINQAASRRADERFIRTLKSRRYRSLLSAIMTESRTVTDLSKLTGESKEHTSRKLNVLRGHGIVGFQKEGTRVFNFLTPDAITALQDLKIFEDDAGRVGPPAVVMHYLVQIWKNTDERHRQVISFGQTERSRTEHEMRKTLQ